jgi:hypothetical protein
MPMSDSLLRGDADYTSDARQSSAVEPALEAFKSVSYYVKRGIIWGFGLLIFYHGAQYIAPVAPDPEKIGIVQYGIWQCILFVGFIAEHLGIGLIVSSVAVFFYEWGAHSRKVIDLARSLTLELKKQTNIANSMAGSALRSSLDVLFRSDSGSDQCRETVEVLESLVKTMRSGTEEIWGNDRYLKVITRLLGKLRDNADSLFNRPGESHINKHIRVPRVAAEIADAVLAAQMSAMGEGDIYMVVSDFSSWQGGQLPALHIETMKAVKERGVRVKRIFNVAHEATSNLSSSDAAEVLREHIEDAEEWSRGKGIYEIGVFGLSELQKLSYDIQDEAKNLHSGLFIHGVDRVRFVVAKRDLSDLSLSPEEIESPSLSVIDRMWNVSRKFIPDGRDANEVSQDIDALVSYCSDGLLSKNRFEQIRNSLDSDFLELFGEHFDSMANMIGDVIAKRELILKDVEEYRLFYKKAMRAYPGITFYATSLPSESGFWSEGEVRKQSVEESIREFTSHGGKFERIFFLSPNTSHEVMNVHDRIGVEVFSIDSGKLNSADIRYFLVPSNGKFAAEAFLNKENIVYSVMVTLNKSKIEAYLHRFEMLKKHAAKLN